MKRHVIYGRYGTTDTVTVPVRDDETGTEISLLSAHNKLEHGIGAALDELLKMGVFPSVMGVDLLVFAAHVQAADTRISRYTESQDSWTREIRLVVPVSDVEVWTKAASVIKRALDFLTGDLWTIEFRSKPEPMPNVIPTGTLPLQGIPFDEVSLFSGGLDSLIGAIDMLEGGKTPLLISHAGDGTTSGAQAECYKTLKEQYATTQFDRLRLWMDMGEVEVVGSKHEMTTRGRSFLFFAAGIFAGTGLDKPFTLKVPENGLIALNVPLDPLRLGSHSTRTTHPFYIARWNEMLGILGIPGNIENPYWNKTKGEMVADCANKKLLQTLVPHSLSCSSPSKGRWQKLPAQHCGYCLPCLIRRAALEKGLGKGADKTTYTMSDLTKRPLNSVEAEGKQIRSFQYAIHRLSARPRLATTLIHLSGSLSDETPEQQTALAAVYGRGLGEVEQILKGVRTQAK
jgi:hypothetical protein